MNQTQVFRQLAMDRGRQLRALPCSRLAEMQNEPAEDMTLGTRKGTFSLVVKTYEDGSVKVVVQGFLKSSWLPRCSSVALDGFYKHSDGSVTEMQDFEFYDYD